MNWNDMDDKFKTDVDGQFVSCDEAYEKAYIVSLILKEFPQLHKDDVEKAVTHCCRLVPAPHKRSDFMMCLKSKLA